MAFQNNSQYDNLIKQASAKVGASPAQLKAQIDSGKLDALLKTMKPADAAKFQQAMSDPRLAAQLLNSPAAQMLIKQFMK